MVRFWIDFVSILDRFGTDVCPILDGCWIDFGSILLRCCFGFGSMFDSMLVFAAVMGFCNGIACGFGRRGNNLNAFKLF